MPYIKLSDIKTEESEIKKIQKPEIFREYVKENNKFVATNNYFVSDNDSDSKYIKTQGNSNEKYIEKKNNRYVIHYEINYKDSEIISETKEVDLILIKNIDLEMNNETIDIKKLIKSNEINNNDCDLLLQDLYFNTFYYDKFDIKINNKNITNSKKYLFKIKKGEINIKSQIEQRCNYI